MWYRVPEYFQHAATYPVPILWDEHWTVRNDHVFQAVGSRPGKLFVICHWIRGSTFNIINMSLTGVGTKLILLDTVTFCTQSEGLKNSNSYIQQQMTADLQVHCQPVIKGILSQVVTGPMYKTSQQIHISGYKALLSTIWRNSLVSVKFMIVYELEHLVGCTLMTDYTLSESLKYSKLS